MRILLLSDTHGHIDNWIEKHAAWADEIWHAGDIGDLSVIEKLKTYSPVRVVYGNIDGTEARAEFPLDLHWEIQNFKIFMTHIAGYPGTYKPRVNAIIKRTQPQLVITGHSHILKVVRDTASRHLHMNPGAAGVHGFHKVRTMLRFEILGGKPANLEVIEKAR